MKRIEQVDFKQTFGDVPASFASRVSHTLNHLDETPQPKGHAPLRTAILIAALLTLTVTALAAIISQTTDWFGAFYGEDFRRELEGGDLAPGGQSVRMGDIVFTLNDVVAVRTEIPIPQRDENGQVLLDADGEPICDMANATELYVTGVLAPAEGAKIILMPEDYTASDVYGYDLYYGDLRPEDIPPDAPTYADKAAETDASIKQVRALGNWFAVDEQSPISCTIGYAAQPQPDGTILIASEFIPNDTCDASDHYILSFYIAQEDVDEHGSPLRDTRVAMDWTVSVSIQSAE